MKAAIFHNALDTIGGAEKVCLTMARDLKADLYSTVWNPDLTRMMGFDVNVNLLSRIPRNAPWRQMSAWTQFKSLKLKNSYDAYVVGGDWALPAVNHHHPNLWYVHAPAREIWDLSDYTRNHIVPWAMRVFYDQWVKIMRSSFRKYAKKVDQWVCNSQNTQKRIQKYFGKSATIIYPPVETEMYYCKPPGDYWLSVNRLIHHKEIMLQIEVFRKMPKKKLIIIGSYESSNHFLSYVKKIKKSLPDNVVIHSHVPFDQLKEYYAHCRGFITTSLNEDFGMTAVEAMASGKPVIAPAQGGYLETVEDSKTGFLLNDLILQTWVKTVSKIDSYVEEFRQPCQERAAYFSSIRFTHQIQSIIAN